MLSLKVHRRNDRNFIYVVLSDYNKRNKKIECKGSGLNNPMWVGLLSKVALVEGSERVKDKIHTSMNPGDFVWKIPIEKHDELVRVLQTPIGKESVETAKCRLIEIVPKEILKILSKPSPPDIDVDTLANGVGRELWDTLLPYQRDGVKFIVSRGGRGIIADEMGLGKTLQGIGFLSYYKYNLPAVVLCPAAVRSSWRYHIRTYMGIEPNMIYSHVDDFDMNGINIMSFGMFGSGKFDKKVNEFKPETVVVDESHYVKNTKSGRTKKTFAWCRTAKYVTLLTGTPMNRAVELYSQIKCVDPKLFKRFFHYKQHLSKKGLVTTITDPNVASKVYYASRYCNPTTKMIRGVFSFQFRGADNESELHAILKHRVMIRRTKKEVLTDLPPKLREKIVIDEWIQEIPLEFETDNEFMELVRDTAQRKVDYVRSYIKDILIPELQNDDTLKVLLWGHHHFMLDAMSDEINKSGFKLVQMDGRTNMKKRTARVDKFQNDNDVRVAVLGITAMGTGVTLTAARLTVFSEAAFTPDIHLQAEDRIHRIGQKYPTCVRYLVCDGSTDNIIMRMLDSRMKHTGMTVDGYERYLGGKVMTTTDIKRKKRPREEEIDFSLF